MIACVWKARGFVGRMGFALAIGCMFGVVSQTLRAGEGDECATILSVEAPLAQDTDGDGYATVAEGSVDINGDGVFADEEAEFYNMTCYICWAVSDNCGVVAGPTVTKNKKICLQNWRTKKWRCSNPDYLGNNCVAASNGSSCKSG